MKVRYTGKGQEPLLLPQNRMDLIPGKIYDVVCTDDNSWHWYRIIDESGGDYLYPPELFEIVEG